MRVESLAETITTAGQAGTLLQDYSAGTVIFGNDTSVMVVFEDGSRRTYSAGNDSETIHALSLITLAEICIDRGNPDLAYAMLIGARNILSDGGIENDSITSVLADLIDSISSS